MRAILSLPLVILLAGAAMAAPLRYQLETEASNVGFEWDFGKDRFIGRMPVAGAEIVIDFDDLERSRVWVQLDPSRAQAGFAFATQAMRGPKVLDAGAHPRITFVSNRVQRLARGARIEGRLNIRGIERPVVLEAHLHRQAGSDPGDRSRLTLVLTGAVSRAAFGADGWADMVGDRVGLNIVAQIRQAK